MENSMDQGNCLVGNNIKQKVTKLLLSLPLGNDISSNKTDFFASADLYI